VNAAFSQAAADSTYRGVLEYTDEPLVSADIVHNPSSCVFSARDTMANGNLVKVLGWYDNEWGYSNRLVDITATVGAANQ
jgi:glyceraldehyde 3-phosphate dehydrogenase